MEIHAGPDAKDIKKLPIADHDKVCIPSPFLFFSVYLNAVQTLTPLTLFLHCHLVRFSAMQPALLDIGERLSWVW